MQTETYLIVCRRWWECEGWDIHEDGAVVAIKVVQERREGLVQATVTGDVAVAGRLRGHPQGHPALGGVANRTLLAAHAVATAAQTSSPDNQRQLQDELLTSRNVDVNLVGEHAHTINTQSLKQPQICDTLTTIFKAYHQSILHTDDVAAQHRRFDLWNPDGFSLPGITHA